MFRDLNPQPLEHESPPLTTRPELLPCPAIVIFLFFVFFANWKRLFVCSLDDEQILNRTLISPLLIHSDLVGISVTRC